MDFLAESLYNDSQSILIFFANVTMPRPILATIHTQAIAHNLAQVRRHTEHSGSHIWAVVKANAYGHGIQNILPVLAEHADGLAMLDFSDAQLVRRLGWEKPILMLEGCFGVDDYISAFKLNLATVIHQHTQIEWLKTALQQAPYEQILHVCLKVNTDMNRVGFAAEEISTVHTEIRALEHIGQIGLMTHFANSDIAHGVDRALSTFEQHIAGILTTHPHTPVCTANSAAIMTRTDTHKNWVRPGIMLYGASPFADKTAADCNLQAAMTLSSELISVRTIRAGEGIGYGSRFIAEHDMRIGVVACGYADGYPRHAVDGTPVMVDGIRTRLVGRVSMDMLTVDLSNLPNAQVGSSVELWGQNIPIDEVANHSGTIGYELMCALALRVPVQVQ